MFYTSNVTILIFFWMLLQNTCVAENILNLSFYREHGSSNTKLKYIPGETKNFPRDKKIEISFAKLSPSGLYQNDHNIEKTIDNNTGTIYHSPWSGIKNYETITFEYTLDPAPDDVLDYIKLYPRTSGLNGIIKTAEIWVKQKSGAFEKALDVNAIQTNQPLVVSLPEAVKNPESIKIVVTDAFSGDQGRKYVSLAEVECYMNNRSKKAFKKEKKVFTDASFSHLKSNVKEKHISKIENPFIRNVALHLFNGTYPTQSRVADYRAYRDVHDLARELKTSPYSQFENPTGIYFQEGEEVVLFVNNPGNEEIFLRVRDFGPSGSDHSYHLNQGANLLTMEGPGNGYISYYTNNYKTAQNVKINIASGSVNGYFDKNIHSNQDGKRILDNATSNTLDLIGDHVHLAYNVESLKKYSYEKLHDLVTVYDSIISSQFTIMGLDRYDRIPDNHMFGRVIWRGYMHADGMGAAFHNNTMSTVANPDHLKKSIWGPAHEFGHVNQVRPGMKWVGTTECTNNIYSAWIQYCYTSENLRLEHENIGGTIGGRFNAFLNNALIKNQEWGIQAGPDASYGERNGKWGGDHFVKLVPLWQLHLFFHVAGEGNEWHRPYFWADIFEKVRNTNEQGLTDGELQINFVKNTCEAVGYDLTPFFEKIGMLQPIDKYLDDYTSAQKTITPKMIEEAKQFATQFPKLPINTIQYISGNSIEAYRHKRNLVGEEGKGVTLLDQKIKVDHPQWQNVTVFKTYSKDKLTAITMTGTHSAQRGAFTIVPFPDEATRIEAVAWDGKTSTVYRR